MEEGISKGFIRSSEQVAKNLTTLAAMTNNNPLWKGEHGARRLSEINAGFEGATELQDSNDVLAFRAARNLLGKDAPYYEVMEYLENPENQMALYEEFKKLAAEAEGGDIGAITERLRKRFGWNYTTTGQLLRGETKTDTEIKALMGRQPGLPNPDSPELEWAKMSVETANVQIRAGQVTFDEVLGEFRRDYQRSIGETVEFEDITNKGITGAYRITYMNLNEAMNKGSFEEIQAAQSARDRVVDVDNMLGFALNGFFGWNSSDRNAKNNIIENIRDYADIGQTEEFIQILGMMTSRRREWDKNDTLNPLANIDNIESLLDELRRLSGLTEGVINAVNDSSVIVNN